MNFTHFKQSLGRNLKWLILFPSLIAVLVYFLANRLPLEYSSSTSLYTGLSSENNSSAADEQSTSNENLTVNNAFDNLLATIRSKQTINEVAINLLAQHLMLEQSDPAILGQEGFDKIRGIVSAENRTQLVVANNLSATADKISKFKNSNGDNIILQLLNSDNGYYSSEVINNNLTAERKATSDFLDISYKSNDPGVALWTVRFLSESFINRYRLLKGKESIDVVKWFEASLNEAKENLNQSENKLKDFGIRNKIINYYEQAKFIAAEKENNETDYYKELMNYEAKKRGVALLEDKMESREVSLKNNDELNKMRKELGVLNEKIEKSKLYGNPITVIQPLTVKANKLKKEIQLYVLQYYSLNNTIESVPQNNVLNKWLDVALSADESEAKIKVCLERRKEFDKQYAHYSPIGMALGQLEREVDVAEKQYLEILHGLHLAKLRQQNIQMSNNLQVMDNPSYPVNPIPSQRIPLAIVSFLAGFFLLLALIFVCEMLDSSLRDIETAEAITGLKVFSALPKVNKSNLNVARIENTLLDYAVSNLKIELDNSPDTANNYLITVISNREQEGKTYAAQKLAEKLYELDYSVLFISNDERIDDSETDDRKFRIMRYDITSKFFSAKNEQNLLPEFSRTNNEAYNFVILEIPAISVNAIPNQLIRNSRLSLMMLDARRTWTSSDKYILNLFQRASVNNNNIMLWLNFVKPKNLVSLVGEEPKKRAIAAGVSTSIAALI